MAQQLKEIAELCAIKINRNGDLNSALSVVIELTDQLLQVMIMRALLHHSFITIGF